MFSSPPTDAELFGCHLLEEPLVPVGSTSTASAEENVVLGQALFHFAQRTDSLDLSALTGFLDNHPQSRWRAALFLNLGLLYKRECFFTRARSSLEAGLAAAQSAVGSARQVLADRLAAELLDLNSVLGRIDQIDSGLQALGNRRILGSARQKMVTARERSEFMKSYPDHAFACGPYALDKIKRPKSVKGACDPLLIDPDSPGKGLEITSAGVSLTQLKRLAKRANIEHQPAKRSPGADFPVPSLIHFKEGHFAALIARRGDRYCMRDSNLGRDIWVSKSALEEECSGYALIAKGRLPAGWRSVSDSEGENARGGCHTGTADPDNTDPREKATDDCGGTGMARYSIQLLLVNLHITDTPLAYTPPRGLAVSFTLFYNHREANQPQNFSYSNFGRLWAFGWLGYVTEDATATPYPASVSLYERGGGTKTYTFPSGAGTDVFSDSNFKDNTRLHYLAAGSYERLFSDGSKEVYSLPEPGNGTARKVFLTDSYDPQGNRLHFSYDANYRLTGVTDALGQVTTFEYNLPDDIYKVTKITDPFGRFASFAYTSGQLTKITDVIGIESQFSYQGDFIEKLTTPYGDTLFAFGESGTGEASQRWLEVADPLGGKERVLFYQSGYPGMADSDSIVPTGMNTANLRLANRNTFYWDKKAMTDAPGVLGSAHIYHWLHDQFDTNKITGVLESERAPLENRIWYNYPGQQPPYYNAGTSSLVTAAGRVLDDGSTQLYQYEYNATGKVTKRTDPSTPQRVTTYKYDTNDIDPLEVYQQNPQGASTDPFGAPADKIAVNAYNTLHEPLTSTDASGQTTNYTYNSAGQIHTIENPKHEITAYNYDDNGYLQNIVGAMPAAITSFTYDGFGRQRTVTDSEGYTVTTDYDDLNRITKVSYPDGTYEQIVYGRLDPEWKRDRLGRWTRNFYDALRHLIVTVDPELRFTQYTWCTCGSLESIIDPNGNKTAWTRDVQSRVTAKIYPDRTSTTQYTYENTTSRLKTITDAQGQVTSYTYFIDNDLQQVSYTNAVNATPSVSYSYDPNYDRLLTMTDGTGVTTYAYNPITASPAVGAGRLASIDGPLDNDTITYRYDELGRPTNRSINGTANASSMQYDALGRIQSAINPLGTFAYSYVNTTPRIDHIDYPDGQKTQYSYFPLPGDPRLRTISNLTSGGAVVSKFDYTYNAVGDIMAWSQQADASTPSVHSFGYDGADQLLGDTVAVSGATQHQYSYSYDRAGNRTTEQIDSSVVPASYNNLNQLTSHGGNGQMIFEGTLSESGTVAIAGGSPLPTDGSNHFRLAAPVTIGSNSISIVATDVNGNSTSNHIQLMVSGDASQTLSYDLNGNLVSDGTKTYEWDAVNRSTAITSGTHRSEFTYNGLNQRVKVVEKDNGSVTSTKQFVWCPGQAQPCEERDGSNAVAKRFYAQGEQIGGASYFYTEDHLGSIREMTDSSGVIHARYDYDPYGRLTKVQGDLESDFTYAGYYNHSPSGLYATLNRFYDADLARWISRDPIEENGGLNLYGYVGNNAIMQTDPSGEGWITNIVTFLVNLGQAIRNPNAPTTPGKPGVTHPAALGGAVTKIGYGVECVKLESEWKQCVRDNGICDAHCQRLDEARQKVCNAAANAPADWTP